MLSDGLLCGVQTCLASPCNCINQFLAMNLSLSSPFTFRHHVLNMNLYYYLINLSPPFMLTACLASIISCLDCSDSILTEINSPSSMLHLQPSIQIILRGPFQNASLIIFLPASNISWDLVAYWMKPKFLSGEYASRSDQSLSWLIPPPLTLIAQVILNMVLHALCLYICYSLDGIYAHPSPSLFDKLFKNKKM